LDDARSRSAAPEEIGLTSASLPEEEAARADIYRLLARLLAAPPDAATIAALTRMARGEGAFGDALRGLARAAAGATADGAAREYHDLFIGVGRGELLPYASYYLTGFLHERPLADLRAALAGLGIARAGDVAEPEDHIAFLCEVMAGLVAGAFGPAAPLAAQRDFFDAFLAPWAPRFFADLEGAHAARLYAPLGRLGRLFLAIEQTAFAIA
jgi:TorA maturation chaperone TorD